MKTAMLFVVVAGGAFGLMALQSGLFDNGAPAERKLVQPPVDVKLGRFPEDLIPVRHGKAAPGAATFQPGPQPHRLAVLRYDGALHSWQELITEDWQADAVENTELVLFVSTQRRTFLSRQTYPNGAPPVDRYRYDLDVYLMEARSGRTLAYNSFYSLPRPIRRREAWALTELGQPVAFSTVFEWVKACAAAGHGAATAHQ